MTIDCALDRPFRLPTVTKAATIPGVSTLQPTDEELLERVGRRDHDAFEVLYRRYSRSVLGLALRRLGDRGRAEDALQETFTAIWRAAKTYRPERGAAAPWLFAVARNSISDRGRARREPPAEAPDEPSLEAGPGELAEQSWLSWRVHSALETLPEHERQLIELAYWSGLSQSEIADMVGIPLGTVKTRTRSALARLADQLEEELRQQR
jgi:RNA polymerase sigma-70 factor, ECF subfamily